MVALAGSETAARPGREVGFSGISNHKYGIGFRREWEGLREVHNGAHFQLILVTLSVLAALHLVSELSDQIL